MRLNHSVKDSRERSCPSQCERSPSVFCIRRAAEARQVLPSYPHPYAYTYPYLHPRRPLRFTVSYYPHLLFNPVASHGESNRLRVGVGLVFVFAVKKTYSRRGRAELDASRNVVGATLEKSVSIYYCVLQH